jgi:hypothetical protein
MNYCESNESLDYSIEFEDSLLDEAVLVGSADSVSSGRRTTTTVYTLPDGTSVTEVFERSAGLLRSANGTDSATRTRTISDWGSITVSASFHWWTDTSGILPIAYVQCTAVSASKNISSQAVMSTWDVERTPNAVSIGKASGWVDYYMYNSQIPVQYRAGTVKISCTDSGTISDNA